jgi:drug/metabolite transporter (DMT)-like permease
MSMRNQSLRRKAIQMLLLATVFWGMSFPTMKSVVMVQQRLLPNASTWFFTSLGVTVRFGAALLIMLFWTWSTFRRMSRLEVWQGLGLGLFGGAGLLFQMDGLAYTSASVSAFLTQCYCLSLPVLVALRDRRWPSPILIASCAMVVAGVAVLAGVDWRSMKLGRGEWETLIGSVLFTGQILWLERPLFAQNNVNHFTLVMFAVTALTAAPVSLLTMQRPQDLLMAYHSPAVVGFMVILVAFCTMISYVAMNYWQRFVPATEAGLIYCVEPVFASLFALFLPGWFSIAGGFGYANESVTTNLLVGGGLITAANVLLQVRNAQEERRGEARAELLEKR